MKKMKIDKQIPVVLEEVIVTPDIENRKSGVIYYTETYGGAGMFCPCGCGQWTYVRVCKGEWSVTQKEPLTMTPSFQQLNGCKTHYIVDRGFFKIFA